MESGWEGTLQDGEATESGGFALDNQTPSFDAADTAESGETETADTGETESQEGEPQDAVEADEAKEPEETEESTDDPKGEAKDEQKLDGDLEKFAVGKGYDVEELRGSETLQKMLKSYKSSEAEMLKAQDKAKKLEADAEAAAVQLADMTAKTVEDVSPVAKVKQEYTGKLDELLTLHKCGNEDELAANQPQVYNNLLAMYQNAMEEARDKEVDWRFSQRDAQQKQQETQRTLENNLIQVRDKSQQNMAAARDAVKGFDEAYDTSGTSAFVKLIADTLGVGPEYIQADDRAMGFLTKATKAISTLASGEIHKTAKKEVEDGIKKAKTAELVGSEPLSDDHHAVFASLQGGKRNQF